jgi:hypothetical protein
VVEVDAFLLVLPHTSPDEFIHIAVRRGDEIPTTAANVAAARPTGRTPPERRCGGQAEGLKSAA